MVLGITVTGTDSGVEPILPERRITVQPVRILIENRMQEPTAVHWHGMELESYYDGVPGFSGTAGSATPPIPPGSSFEARFTPPRFGTFWALALQVLRH